MELLYILVNCFYIEKKFELYRERKREKGKREKEKNRKIFEVQKIYFLSEAVSVSASLFDI